MDIRLIRDIENNQCHPVNDNLVLKVADDDSYYIEGYTGKKLYIVDINTNVSMELLPELRKYTFLEISDVSTLKDFIYFTTAELMEDNVKITLIRYDITNDAYEGIYTFEIARNELESKISRRVFILDENYIFVQNETPINYTVHICEGLLEINNFLYSIQDCVTVDIADRAISQFGIDRIIPIDKNMCAIKIGYSLIEERLYNNVQKEFIPYEIIGIVNIKQFISDLLLKKEQVYIDELDHSCEEKTFPYMRYMNTSIIYSRVDIHKRRQEVIIYDYDTNITKVRVNSNVFSEQDLWNAFIINDIPFLFSVTDRLTKLINLNTQKTEWKLGSEFKVRYIRNDIIIVEKHVEKGILKKESDYILAYKYPDFHTIIFKEKAKYQNSIITTDNKLLIFSN